MEASAVHLERIVRGFLQDTFRLCVDGQKNMQSPSYK